MNRIALRIVNLASLIALISGLAPGVCPADEGKPSAPRAIPAEVVRQAHDVVEAVLGSHFDPPTRQEMLLSGIKALHKATGAPVPPDLARRVSDAADFDQLAALMNAAWTGDKPVERLKTALLEGLLSPVAGNTFLMTEKEYNVQQQIEGNRYEGVHIQLASEGEGDERRPIIAGVVPDGPADRAGVKVKDRIEAVDGVDTRGMALKDVVERIRGPLDSTVVFKVRQPDSQDARTLKMTRERLFMPTITGVSKRPSGNWEHRLSGAEQVAYLRIERIAASTPHELRQIAERLDDAPSRGVILDLRGLQNADFHAALLLADSLLGSGSIGRLQAAGRTTTFQADADELFRGRPIVVVIDELTQGVSEWFTAALQDNDRAKVVGSPQAFGRQPVRVGPGFLAERRVIPQGRDLVYEFVPAGDGHAWLRLAVAWFERIKKPDRPHRGSFKAGPAFEWTMSELGPELDPLAIRPDHKVVPKDNGKGRDGPRRGPFTPDEPKPPLELNEDPYVAGALATLQGMAQSPRKPKPSDRPRESK